MSEVYTVLSVEVYREDNNYCAYIGEDGSSGYSCEAATPEKCADQVKGYIEDIFYREDEEDEE